MLDIDPVAEHSSRNREAVMGRLVIYGAGGFGREVVTAARGRDTILVDDRGAETMRPSEIGLADEVVIGISDGYIRRNIAESDYRWGKVIAPTSVIGGDVTIGEGAIFCDFTMVTSSARIGRHFQCNIYSYVAHDCIIGDYVTFAPKVCCNGNVHIGNGAYIGAGAVLKNGSADRPLTIGAGAVIGCGAVVTRDVPPGVTVVGNPARILQPRLIAA